MRLIFAALLISLSCTVAWSFLDQKWDTRARFDMFASKFQKSFVNSEDREKRYSVFKKNIREIEDFNRKADKDESSVRQGVNAFTELDYEEFVSLYTGLRGDVDPELVPANNSTKKKLPLLEKALRQSVPSSKNWVAEGKVVPVKNQGSCGACWAFATVAVVESLNAIRGKPLISLSEQQLMDCNFDSKRGNWACQGGFFPTAFSYVNNDGIMKRSDYPYTGQRSHCRYAQSKAIVRANDYEQIKSENYLKAIVGSVGPVAVGIYVSPVFQRYSSGIIDDSGCMNRAPNHGVVVVGYGSDRGRDYWMIRNSWGPNWGEAGYFRMARGKNMCNILSMAYYAEF